MNRSPWNPSPCAPLAVLLALGCAAPATALPPGAAVPQEPTGEAAQGPPIRFGDPDEHAYDAPFFPGATYDEGIPTPDSILRQEHATRLSHHDEILACFRAWAETSPRVRLAPHGTTHEGRELVHAVVTSPANLARLDAIRDDLARLHDPRGLSGAEGEAIVTRSPAVAWLGYSIHGDEVSGSDAAVAFGYHLVASTDADVAELLERVVVVIDPCMNPDGRERIVGMVEQSFGYTPNLDYASMHRGRWPYGRGNHYLFDMNRDWMTGTQPETQGRWRAARSFYPQLFVDAHEMWALDTFLFYPQSSPHNPALPLKLGEWQQRYAEGAAAAFDRHGWSYYTREWADAWAPFYSDSWGSLAGATGILYEQASTTGVAVRRPSGEVLTYRESVHHQAAASLANVETLADNREAALRDYLENQRRNVAPNTPGNDRTLVVVPGKNADRERELLRILEGQGIEAHIATESFGATGAVSALGEEGGEREFSPGSILIHPRQPLRQMVRAFLDFDVRMPAEDLKKEREELERKGDSRIYDVTSWSLVHALDLDAWWCDAVDVASDPVPSGIAVETRVLGSAPAVAWVVDAADDAAVAFAARALERGVQLNASDEAFAVRVEGELVTVPAGSLLVRAIENEGAPELVEAEVLLAALEAGVRVVYRTGSGLSPDEGPDLGGQHFSLLARPRVALLGNAPVASDAYGHLWFHLDTVLGMPFTLLDAQQLGGYDLRRYNVIVLPPAGGGLRPILEGAKETLADWVEGGGTLIACGGSAALLTSGGLGLSSVTLRRDALEDLTPYRIATEREWGAQEVEIDEALVWGDPAPPAPVEDEEDGEEEEEEDGEEDEDAEEEDASDLEKRYAAEEIPEEHDRWQRLFSTRGVTLRGIVDPDAWIARGCGEELPVFQSGSYVLLSKSPVRTAVRLAEADQLRLSGLAWPEARERLGGSAWLTVERSGNGQVILFAANPAFRGYNRATARLFANAVVLGPGLGASQPADW